MLEFLGFVLFVYIIYVFISSDELLIDIKVDGKTVTTDVPAKIINSKTKGLEISNSHKNLLSKTDETIMKDIPERDERGAMYVLEKMLDNLVEN